ncbi:hypothetical protein CDL12_16294 [Handroanthus impetiginosus]|uniref:Uncharacterized protein n=1 Tax=Handroanthus impetiginosus TaxID=429701 RepID=A0A2G9H0Q7_9LAMI|nr:hypothetical protein CDL12_16294 [Handroanthus impetiginosus]
MKCLDDLISLSVVYPEHMSPLCEIKSWRLCSPFWYLGTREARKEKFFHVLDTYPNSFEESIKDVHNAMKSITRVVSLRCTGPEHHYPVPLFTGLKLLKVPDVLTICFYNFPNQVLKLIHLRDQSYLPIVIWDMQELKHLQIMRSNLPDPCGGALLPNLLSLLYISVNSCTKEIFERLPMLKKLGVRIELVPDAAEPMYLFYHPSVLQELESFKCVIVNPNPRRSQIVAPPTHFTTFPAFFKRLSLSGLGYPRECTRVIAQLPILQSTQIAILCLSRPIVDTDLVHWKAKDGECFPYLKHLIISHCYRLKEVPSSMGIGAKIEAVDCPLVVDFVLQFQNENRVTELRIHSTWDEGKPMLRKKVEFEWVWIYPWERIRVIAQLPNLIVLKLRCYAFRGPECVIHDGEFKALQYLLLEDSGLVHWKAKIPVSSSIIGNVFDCPSIVDYVQQVQKEIAPWINLCIQSSWDDGKPIL